MTQDDSIIEVLSQRIAKLEDALKPFADAHDYALKIEAKATLGTMDSRDYFMWQANRSLCVKNFTTARACFHPKSSEKHHE